MLFMEVVAVSGGDETWLNSLLLHFNVSVQLNGGKGNVDPRCGQVIHSFI